MKTIMKKLTVLLVLMMALSLAACTSETNNDTQEEANNQQEVVEENTLTIDYSAYPENFADFTTNDLKELLKSQDLLSNEEFILMDLTEGDLTAMGAASGFIYVDATGGTDVDTVVTFDGTTE